MTATFYRLALGTSARAAFERALARSPRAEGTLLLPSDLVKKRAQLESDVRISDMDALAQTIINNNNGKHYQRIQRRTQELLVRKCVERLTAAGRLQYYAPLSQKDGFIKAMTKLIGQLRRAGVTLDEWQETLAAWDRKGAYGLKDAESAIIYASYLDELYANDLYDLEGIYGIAIEILRQEAPRLNFRRLYICDFASFNKLELTFFKELARHADLHLALCVEQDRKEIFGEAGKLKEDIIGALQAKTASLDFDDAALERAPELEALTQKLFQPASEHLTQGEAVRFAAYPSEEEEIRGTLRQVKELLLKGVEPQEILITAKNLDDYSGLWRVAAEYGLPLALPGKASLAQEPLGEFVLLLLAAAPASREGTAAYLKLLTCAWLRLYSSCDLEALRLATRDNFYNDREAVNAALSAGEYAISGFNDDSKLKLIRQFLTTLPESACIEEYHELISKLLSELETAATLCRRYQSGLFTPQELRQALTALVKFEETLADLAETYRQCGLAAQKVRRADYAKILRQALAQVKFVVAPASGGVTLAAAAAAQGLHFPYVFLLGLNEGKFPASFRENWLYNDAERKELAGLGVDLTTSEKNYYADAYLYAQLLALAQKRLVLSWRDHDEAQPSVFILKTLELYEKKAEDVATDCLKLKPPAASVSELWLQGALSLTPWLDALQAQNLQAAAEVDALRANKSGGVYNGMLPNELQAELKARINTSFSPSVLEKYAHCPFQYLGSQVWCGEMLEDKDEATDPRDEGTILHAVLAQFTEELITEGGKLTSQAKPARLKRLREIFQAKNAKAFAGNIFLAAEAGRLWNMLVRWLNFAYNEEENWGVLKPYAAEQRFGFETEKSLPALPLALSDGSTVEIRGIIDCIDSTSLKEKIYITDYKRSGTPAGTDIEKGIDLQLPIYLLAAKHAYPDKVLLGGSYYSLSDRQRKSKLLFSDINYPTIKKSVKFNDDKDGHNDWESFQNIIENKLINYIEEIYQGEFSVAPKKGNQYCKYCPQREICRNSLSQNGLGGEGDA